MNSTNLTQVCAPKPKLTSLPADLVGRWTDGTSFYAFADDGAYSIGGPAVDYMLSANGDQLTLDGTTFNRIGPACNSIVGLWLSVSGAEEWHFRSDGTHTLHETNGNSYDGTYEADGAIITRLEKRAFVVAEGNLLTFQPTAALWEPAAYQRSGDELTLIFQSGIFTWTLA